TVKNNDLDAYTQRFQELTMLCTKIVPKEEDRVKKFIGGLPDYIQGNVIAAEPARLQDAVRAGRSFVSTTFSTLLDITPDTLDISYAIELADGRISKTNTVHIGCTLRLLGHPFNIDLMPVEVGSFDVIISMDWLANHHTKETEDKSKEKRLKDVPMVRDFLEVFPKDLHGLPPI
nr:reverse transcriptase domain-containing protein [Tanacetum cinerariifolium]